MSTYPVKLTKASDNSVVHSFMLDVGREEQPRVRLGSREKEAAKAGQRGVIVIESLHRGSGQHVARDPMMYEFADGMFADEPGVARNRGVAGQVRQVGTAQAFRSWARGGLFAKATLTQLETDPFIVVTPTQIYEVTASASTPKLAPIANAHFTGSFARFNDHVFFGQEYSDNGRHYSAWAGRYTTSNGAYTNNAGFNASFLATQGEKMWRASKDSGAKASLAWTDDSNASPVFTTDYSMLISSLDIVRDMAVIGPHAVVAVARAGGLGLNLVAVDASGMFTDILSGLPAVEHFTPFLGGQLLWLAGRPRALWFQDVNTYRELRVGGIGQPFGAGAFPNLAPLGAFSSSVNEGVGAAEVGPELFLGLYGDYRKRDGTAMSGSVILQGVLQGDGLTFHTIATPEAVSSLTNACVMAGGLFPAWASADPLVPRRLYYVTATPEANAQNSTVSLDKIEMWDGSTPPAAWDTGTKFLHTSRYVGDHWTTKQGELLRGYITQLPASNSVVVRVYLDGDTAETYNFTVNTAGPFAHSLPTNVIGRDIALDVETNCNGAVVVEFPWSIDYFAMPDKKDIVRLAVLAGRDQLTTGGTLTDETRAEVLQTLSDMCASPERWTLAWWDATPDWDVIPLEYEAIEDEPAHVEGGGAAVAWLTLQRL